ncbi:MAG: hypothetical protein ABIU54_14525 [Candidatus Eisenbacteria bacterium]
MRNRSPRFTLLSLAILLWTAQAAVAEPIPARAASPLGVEVRADTVVFRFTPSRFRMVVSHSTSRWMRLRDLSIREVTVAGPWNQWSTDAWPLHARKGFYELRCPLSAVADHDTVSFKFVVNRQWWVQPPPDTPNQINAGLGDTTMNLFFVRPGKP